MVEEKWEEPNHLFCSIFHKYCNKFFLTDWQDDLRHILIFKGIVAIVAISYTTAHIKTQDKVRD